MPCPVSPICRELVFRSAHGIGQAAWRYLRDQLVAAVVGVPVRGNADHALRHAQSGRWPAGTVGTVIEASDASALIEIADNRGHAIDFVSLPHEALASAGANAARAAS